MKKKVLFVLINMNLGGTERSLLNLIAALPDEIEIDVLLLEEEGELQNEFPENINLKTIENQEQINEFIQIGCRRFAFNELRKGNLILFLKNIFVLSLYKINILKHTFYGISNLIKEEKKDYDIAVAYAAPHDFISYWVAEKVKAKKKVQWIHFDIEKVISSFSFGKKYYPKFDQIYCVSKSAKDIFLKHYPEQQNKTTVFENIINQQELILKAVAPSFTDYFQGIRILTVGRIALEKGQQMIPEVAEKLHKEGINFRWYLIGDGDQRKVVEEMIKQKELQQKVIFLGERNNPYPFMKDCDLYVQPSLHEGYGLTVAETKVFNKPMVITNFASAKNLINNDETGRIADINSVSLFENIAMLLSNPELMEKFSTALKLENENKKEPQGVAKLLRL